MANFSKRSKEQLASCDERLQVLFEAVVKIFDCSVIEGHRGEKKQKTYYETGRSQLPYPESKHNSKPSMAVDVVPYPIDWNDKNRFYAFVGFVKGVALSLNIKVRSGADWDNDNDYLETKFIDLAHWELIEE